MIGKTIGKYRVVERLGRGGMGTVYKAIDETLDREVAIKVLNPDLGDPEVLKRFRAEAVTLARLSHPGIATIYELDRSDDELLMVMEFVRGETFNEMSERLGPLAVPQAAHLCMQVLDALGHAHRAGIVHRDLKPANLMIADTGVVKVMDFGIARVLGSEHVTHAGYMMGTPAYMAPEQVLGEEVDGRADLYAIGVVLYRLLTGQLPFRADTAVAMVQKHIADEPTPLSTYRPDLPEWCAAVVDRALAKSPADRFQSAEEFRAALSGAVKPAALGELPTVAEPTPHGLQIGQELERALDRTSTQPSGVRTTAVRADVAAGTGGGAPMPPAPAARSTAPADGVTTTVVLGRTHLLALGAVVIVLVVGVAVLAFLALRQGQSNQQGVQGPAPLSGVPAVPAESDSELPKSVPRSDSGAAAAPPPPPAPVAPAPPSTAGPDSAKALPGPDAGKPVVPAPGSAPGKAGARVTAAEPRKTAPGTATRESVPAPPPPTAVASKPSSPESAAPMLPPVIFSNVRLLVMDGDKSSERDGLLLLDSERASILDKPGGTALASSLNSTLAAAFFSRSKQPRWRDAQGKEGSASVDLGKLGFLKSERNWVILVPRAGAPVIFRCEDSSLSKVLAALQERIGVPVQRYVSR